MNRGGIRGKTAINDYILDTLRTHGPLTSNSIAYTINREIHADLVAHEVASRLVALVGHG